MLIRFAGWRGWEAISIRLDVGCGSNPKGEVNVDFFRAGWNKQEADQDKGEYVNPHKIPNFVVASAEYLPFRENVFDAVYSSHTIEHVKNPFLMFSELARVSRRKVVVKCPHCGGSGAKRPFHVSYLDEHWFINAVKRLGFVGRAFISVFDDAPVTSRLFQVTPKPFKRLFSRNIPYRVVRRVERKIFGNAKIPFEVECHLVKKPLLCENDPVVFVVVHNDAGVFEKCFKSGVGVQNAKVIDLDNRLGFGLGFAYNDLAIPYLSSDVWLVFCHQDFILNESLSKHLQGLDKHGVYGVIGSRLGTVGLLGQITQTDGSKVGTYIKEPTPVDTLDELCLIVHTQAFRDGLMFDDRLTFHYYGADLCMQAHDLGFDVLALQVDCQHKSRTLTGDVNSQLYHYLRLVFKKKWSQQLPVVTTTGLIKK